MVCTVSRPSSFKAEPSSAASASASPATRAAGFRQPVRIQRPAEAASRRTKRPRTPALAISKGKTKSPAGAEKAWACSDMGLYMAANGLAFNRTKNCSRKAEGFC